MKTRFIQILSVVAFALIVSSCKKPKDPAAVSQASADFAYDTSVNKTVPFQNLSRNYTSLTWDFGAGKTSTEIYPVHVYAATGTVSVKLTVTGGNEASVTKTVKVN